MGKKLALMQPYFFPYLGYYTIMKHVEYYVYFDTAQYIKGGWINRNRILRPDGNDWQYLILPVRKHTAETHINNIRVDNSSIVKRRILKQLEHYRKQAHYYDSVMEIVKEALQQSDNISEINICADRLICAYLGIKAPEYILSEGELNYKKTDSADEWGLNICLSFKDVSEYWNAPGGKSFFDTRKYDKHGIDIHFVKTNLREYKQKVPRADFIPGLSMIDVMMFNSPEEINDMLDEFSFI